MSEDINELLNTPVCGSEELLEDTDTKVNLDFLKDIGVLDENLNTVKGIPKSLYTDQYLEFLKGAGVLDENFNLNEELKESSERILTGLVRDNPKTPEGKYLILRRDGSVVEFPVFVLGARDPYAAKALRYYADLLQEEVDKQNYNIHHKYPKAIKKWADVFDDYRKEHGESKPCSDKSDRVDCPLIIALMKAGKSA
jgi:hypothetical protein